MRGTRDRAALVVMHEALVIICTSTFPILHLDYWNHLSRSFFLTTIGPVTMIAANNPATVKTNWTLLKFSLNTSKVLDGATRVPKKSSP